MDVLSFISLALELSMNVLASFDLEAPVLAKDVSPSLFFIADVGELNSCPFGLPFDSLMTMVFIRHWESRTDSSCVLICLAKETVPAFICRPFWAIEAPDWFWNSLAWLSFMACIYAASVAFSAFSLLAS